MVNLTGRMIAANRLEKPTGVYVYEVVPDQPADNNAIRQGDIIVSFNGHAVGTVDELHKQLHSDVIGKTVELEVLRSGRKETIRVRPGEMR
jgi:S1-C subfamily serine protease